MNNSDKQFFQSQTNLMQNIQTQITDLSNSLYSILEEREKRYTERKESYDAKQDELHQAVIKLFGKTDGLQDELSNVVNKSIQVLHSDLKTLDGNIIKKIDLLCPIHEEKIKQVEGSINRIFAWIWAIVIGMIAVFWSKK